MPWHEFIIITVAGAIVTADVLARLRFAPARRDAFVGGLLQMLSGRGPRHARREFSDARLHSLAHSLLKHFDRSFASRNIVATLARAPGGMSQKELEARFAELSRRAGTQPLRTSVLRKVILILLRADIVKVSDGRLKITRLGSDLNDLLTSRHAA